MLHKIQPPDTRQWLESQLGLLHEPQLTTTQGVIKKFQGWNSITIIKVFQLQFVFLGGDYPPRGSAGAALRFL